jgi:hypothetical protein
MAHIFIVGSGTVATTAGGLLCEMGYRVTFVDVHELVVAAIRSKGYDACLANDIDHASGPLIFLASEDRPEPDHPRGSTAPLPQRTRSLCRPGRPASDVPCATQWPR